MMGVNGAILVGRRLLHVLPNALMGQRPPWPLLVLGVAVGLAALLPAFYLFVRAVDGGAETWDLVFRARTAQIIRRTALLVGIVTVISTVLGTLLAWFTLRTDIPFRRVMTVAVVLPFVIPSFVMATTAIQFFGPSGVLESWLAVFGMDRISRFAGLRGAIFVLVLMTYPYVFLAARGALRRLDPVLEEAARSMGYGAVQTFRMVTVPILRPALTAGALLVALYTLSDFGGVAMVQYETFTFVIFNHFDSALSRSVVAGLSLVLVIFAVILLAGEGMTRGRAKYHRSTAGAIRPTTDAALGIWRWPVLGFVSLPVIAGLGMPVGVLTWWLVRGLLRDQTMTALLGPAWNSIAISLAAALLTVVVAMPVAILAVRYRSWWPSRLIERATHIGFGLPGVVVAISLVFFGVNYARLVYQSSWLLLFGYVVLFLPAAVGAIRYSLMQISPRVEEAAQGLGRRPWHVLLTVTLPMVMPGVLAGFALVFLLTMKELPATLILRPIGFKTLATVIWDASREVYIARTAAASLLLIALAGIPTAYMVLRDRTYLSGSNGRNGGGGSGG
jgi:iron(III) transport system permease protein